MSTSILDLYVKSAPGPQNALDIFKGNWSSRFPGNLAGLNAGNALLFEDPRVHWAASELGGFAGNTVLELGPLEGGHSYMLEQLGARSIISIEANTRAYLRCLIAKEILEMKRVRFLCGDFVEFLKRTGEEFDVIFASGVLYHMLEPMELIAHIAHRASKVFLWTHYYSPDVVPKHPGICDRFSPPVMRELQGMRYETYEYHYRDALGWDGFCGGPRPCANWLRRDDIIGGLKHFGYESARTAFETPDHPNGPAFALVATR